MAERRPSSAKLIALARPEDLSPDAISELVAQVRDAAPSESSHEPPDESRNRDLVYFAEPTGEDDPELVFAPRWKAEAVAALRKAIATAKTWRAFERAVPDWALEHALSVLPTEDWLSFDDFLAENEARDADVATQNALLDEWIADFSPGVQRDPLEWERFDATRDYLVGAMADGDWPEWLKQSMLDWFPSEIAEHFGDVVLSTLNGAFLSLRRSDEKAIVKALTEAGFTCRRAERLMSIAGGWSEPWKDRRSGSS